MGALTDFCSPSSLSGSLGLNRDSFPNHPLPSVFGSSRHVCSPPFSGFGWPSGAPCELRWHLVTGHMPCVLCSCTRPPSAFWTVLGMGSGCFRVLSRFRPPIIPRWTSPPSRVGSDACIGTDPLGQTYLLVLRRESALCPILSQHAAGLAPRG